MRKGEKGNLVVYASTVTRTQTDEETGQEQERDIPFMKGYTVFNVEQIDGLPPQFDAPAEPRLDPVQRLSHAEQFFAASGANVRHGGNQAFYSVVEDRVRGRGIRTLGTLARTTVFETAPFNRSGTPPHGGPMVARI